MSLFLDDGDVRIYLGDAREALGVAADGSVHCVATSPPFFGLRDYGTGRWVGGDPDCDHERPSTTMNVGFNERWGQGGGEKRQERKSGGQYAGVCPKCGAARIDSQIGLEATPFDWASSIVEVMREARRVLRDDGSLWIECGDSYASDVPYYAPDSMNERSATSRTKGSRPQASGELKPTDLIGAPWILAQALRAPYYAGEIRAERDRVWLAATLDAEGSISGHRHERRDDPGRVRTGCHVTITNTCEAMLDEAHRIWPASRIQHERRDTSLGERPCWRWVATNVDRNALLMRELYPYLIAKRTQALLAYNLFELSRVSKRIGKTAEGAEARGRREWIVAALSDANHGRPIDLPNWIISPPSVLEKGWYLRGAYCWEKPDCMPESVDNRCTTSHSFVFHLTKTSEDAVFWTHRDGRGTRTKPKPDYRWIHRETGEESAEAQEGREWRRLNLWRGRPYFFDRDAIREPFSDYSTGGDGGSYGSNADSGRTTDSGPRGSTRYQRPRPQEDEHVQPTLEGDVPEAELRGPDGRRKFEHKTGANGHENYANRDGASRWPSLEGRSPRSVWRITTEASSFGLCRVCRTFWAERAPARHCGEDVVAHFAVWPHELVAKIINAATSEAGCCADCGAPRARRTRSERSHDHTTTADHGLGRRDVDGYGVRDGIRVSTEHLGWQPTCECGSYVCLACEDQERGSSTKHLRGLRDGVREGRTDDASAEVLLEDLREPGDREEPEGDEGLHDQPAGVPASAPAGASDGEPRGVRDGAPARDGREDRTDAPAGGGRPSPERGQVGQPPREPRRDDEVGAQPRDGAAGARDAADVRLSSLRRDDPTVERCGVCGGGLTFRPSRSVPATVLDVFGGSGTTARQARAMGRHAILVELSPDYAEIAAHRLAQQGLALV